MLRGHYHFGHRRRPCAEKLRGEIRPASDGRQDGTASFDNYPPDEKDLHRFQAMPRVLISLRLRPASTSKYTVLASRLPAGSESYLFPVEEAGEVPAVPILNVIAP